MKVYRIAKKRYANDLSGFGSSLLGGRWNSKGSPLVYTASSKALAVLEVFVNIGPSFPTGEFAVVEIDIPDDLLTTSISSSILPANWSGYESTNLTQSLGDNWLKNNMSIALQVPSVIVPDEFNILINPKNPDFYRVRISSITEFYTDERLVKTEKEIIKTDPIIQKRLDQISKYKYDIFISHSSSDKDSIVIPIVKEINKYGLRYWFDNEKLSIGDSITKKIGDGIRESRFVLTIISKSFVDKRWTMKELETALNMEISSSDGKKVLPVLVYNDSEELEYIQDKIMLMRDKFYFKWANNAESLVDIIVQELSKE